MQIKLSRKLSFMCKCHNSQENTDVINMHTTW